MKPMLTCLTLFLGMIAGAAQAMPFEDLAALDRLIVATVGAEIGQPGGASAPVDRRLKLTACPSGAAVEPTGSFVTVRCAAIGWRIRVPLAGGGGGSGGQALQASAQPAVAVIRRGDPVELLASSGSFSVSTQTVAQEDGRPGQRIRVRSDAKSPIMIAEVAGPGIVRLPGFK